MTVLRIRSFVVFIFSAALRAELAAATAPMPTVVSVEQLREGRYVPGTTQKYMQEFPPWINHTLLALGQRFYRENLHGFAYSALFTGFLFGTDTQRVFISGGNVTEPSRGARRYLANMLNFWYWATADLHSPELFEALNLIHAVHVKMGYETSCRYQMFEKPLIREPDPGSWTYSVDNEAWEALERDFRASRPLDKLRRTRKEFPPRDGGTRHPLNQFAMANQVWSVLAYVLLAPDKMMIGGAAENEEGIWGVLHFWAFLGHGLGLEDRYNICMQPNLAAARSYFRRMLYDYVAPHILHGVAYENRVFMEASLKGASRVVSYDMTLPATETAVVRLVLYRLCIDLFALECTNLRRALTPMGRVSNLALNQIIVPFSRTNSFRTVATMGTEQLLKLHAQRFYGHHFNFTGGEKMEDVLTRGLLSLNQEVLHTSNVHWKGAPACGQYSFQSISDNTLNLKK